MLTTTDARRAGPEQDFFLEPQLRFGIRKPEGWRFLPAAWPPAVRRFGTSAGAERPRLARTPFVAMTRELGDGRQPQPTIQVTCRPMGRLSAAEIRLLLDAQLEVLSRELSGFERLATSFDTIIGGHRAAHVRYRCTLELRFDGRTTPVPVLTRSYLVPAPGRAFTITMSGGVPPLDRDETDFAAALASVRIGDPDERSRDTLPGRPRVIGWSGGGPGRSS